MAKINFWKIMGLVGTLSEEISEAMEDDGKIDAGEIISIGKAVIEKLDFPMDEDSMAKMELTIAVADGIYEIAKDRKVTVSELVGLGEQVCAKLGIDLDKEGFKF